MKANSNILKRILDFDDQEEEGEAIEEKEDRLSISQEFLAEEIQLRQTVCSVFSNCLFNFISCIFLFKFLEKKLTRKDLATGDDGGEVPTYRRSVSWKVYFTYFSHGFSCFGWILIVVLFAGAQSFIVATDYWLFVW